MIRAIALTAAAALAAACSPAAETPAEDAPPAGRTGPPAVPDPAGGEPASTLALQAMQFDEFSQVIAPGLGCALEAGDAVMLVASGRDDPSGRSQAAVKIDDEMVLLSARDPGGYETLISGGVFEGSGVTATVTTSGEGDPSGMETTTWAGELTVSREGGSTTLPGSWSCGA